MHENGWLHNHWEYVVAGATVGWALIVWAWRSLTRSYATREELRQCHENVRKRIMEVEEKNSSEHIEIRKYIGDKADHTTDKIDEVKNLLIRHMERDG